MAWRHAPLLRMKENQVALSERYLGNWRELDETEHIFWRNSHTSHTDNYMNGVRIYQQNSERPTLSHDQNLRTITTIFFQVYLTPTLVRVEKCRDVFIMVENAFPLYSKQRCNLSLWSGERRKINLNLFWVWTFKMR